MSIHESHENWLNFEPVTQTERQDPQYTAPDPVLPQCESFEGGLGI